jgi:hypothetical protein
MKRKDGWQIRAAKTRRLGSSAGKEMGRKRSELTSAPATFAWEGIPECRRGAYD